MVSKIGYVIRFQDNYAPSARPQTPVLGRPADNETCALEAEHGASECRRHGSVLHAGRSAAYVARTPRPSRCGRPWRTRYPFSSGPESFFSVASLTQHLLLPAEHRWPRVLPPIARSSSHLIAEFPTLTSI